jgi:hypothetical protein
MATAGEKRRGTHGGGTDAIVEQDRREKPDPGAHVAPELLWDMLKELGTSERHFNTLEAEYRKLASIWLLAGFAGMGFLLKEDLNVGVVPEVAVLGIGLATSIGIFLLWIVDLLVYHRLLDACFIEARKIEALHPELPQVRANMVQSQFGGSVTTRLRWFYILLAAAPVVFSAPLFVLWCEDEQGAFAVAMAVAVLATYVGIISRMIWRDSLSLRRAVQGRGDLGDRPRFCEGGKSHVGRRGPETPGRADMVGAMK